MTIESSNLIDQKLKYFKIKYKLLPFSQNSSHILRKILNPRNIQLFQGFNLNLGPKFTQNIANNFSNYFVKMVIIALVFVSLLLYANKSHALQLPRFINSETKFRSYIYNPSEVYGYIGHYYYQGYIEFGKGENISTITIGNSNAWFVKQLGNRLFLKPVEDNANTNLTVITNKKVYQFQLMAKEAKGNNDKDLIFSVKFIYPETKNKNIFQFNATARANSEEPDLRDLSKYNFSYDATGVPTITPIKMFDDGRFTYFQFSENSVVPAIFSVDPSSGFESMVNYRVTKKYFVIEQVSPQFSLRNGNEIACVYNNKEMRKRNGFSDIKKPPAPASINFQNPTNIIKNPQQSSPNPNMNNMMPRMPRMPRIF